MKTNVFRTFQPHGSSSASKKLCYSELKFPTALWLTLGMTSTFMWIMAGTWSPNNYIDMEIIRC